MEKISNTNQSLKDLTIQLKTKKSKKIKEIKEILLKEGLMELTGSEEYCYKDRRSFLIYSPEKAQIVIVDQWKVTAYLDKLTHTFYQVIYSNGSYYFIKKQENESDLNQIFKLDHVTQNEENEKILLLDEEPVPIPLHTANNPDFSQKIPFISLIQKLILQMTLLQ